MYKIEEMNMLHAASIFLEIIVSVMGIMLATLKKKDYGWLIALTFAIYVFYDLAHFLALNIPENFLYALFFIATVSILWAVWRIYRKV